MERKTILKALAILSAIIASGAAGYWLSPTKIRTVEIVKVIEHKRIDRHVDTETHTIKRPDGTTEVHTVERDRSHEHSDIKTDKSTETEHSRESDRWLATALVGLRRQGLDFSVDPSEITVSLQRSLFFGLYVGPYASLNGDFGLGASYRF